MKTISSLELRKRQRYLFIINSELVREDEITNLKHQLDESKIKNIVVVVNGDIDEAIKVVSRKD